MTQPPQPYGAPQYSSAPFPPGGPAPQPADDGGRGKIWVLIGCGGCTVLAVLLAITLIVVLLVRGGSEGGEEPTSPETTEAQTVGPEGDHGTAESPLPAGTTVVVPLEDGTMDVRVGEISWDARAELEEINSELEAPAEGHQYVVVPFHYTYHGSGEGDPVWDLAVGYVDASGQSHQMDVAVTEHSILDVGSLGDGESAQWDVAFQVPVDSVGTGSVEISALLDFEEPSYFVALS